MTKLFTVTAGTTIEAHFDIRDDDGALGDPGTVTVNLRRGDGTTADISGLVTRDSVGQYHVLITTTQATAGYWVVEIRGSGTGPNVVHDAYFQVEPAELA